MLPTPTPDICQIWDTVALFSPVKMHQKVCKFARNSKNGQNRPKYRVLRAIKGHRLEKSTPPLLVVVVTNIS